MSYRNYTEDQLIQAIKDSTSIAATLRLLGLADKGGNYATIHRHIKRLGIDISHHKGQGWNKGKYFGPKRPIEDYLSNNRYTGSDKLKRRLLKENFFIHKCYRCDLSIWQGVKIPLELEHIDGNHSNNNLNNLTLLCPNCHALTDTYRGKNQKRSLSGESRTRMGITPDSF